ncbi:MAG: M28 family peptidase, partial [Chitinophagaceae bacterium]|nr:M28 family peptidase [Chitinophagaceae bacterium]
MKFTRLFFCTILSSSLLMQSCENEQTSETAKTENPAESSPSISVPDFNADSAYNHIEKQLSFGYRIPGTIGQKNCAAWMQQALEKYCDTVYVQNTIVTAGDGSKLPCINLIGAINPNAKRRILLLTHWDSRPWADEDDSASTKPILAADDAASGVGVLIELGRHLHTQKIPADLGIDIFFTDVEDYGKTEWGEDSYCLGTQYWARNPHVAGYTAEFGILLDMVGAKGASFPIEGRSRQFAPNVLEKVYQAAGRAGYSSYFPFTEGISTVDDHYYVNTLIKIPTIDIINTNNMGFKQHWHTHDDNLSIIDKATLKAV